MFNSSATIMFHQAKVIVSFLFSTKELLTLGETIKITTSMEEIKDDELLEKT
jgi:hypothetical protein